MTLCLIASCGMQNEERSVDPILDHYVSKVTASANSLTETDRMPRNITSGKSYPLFVSWQVLKYLKQYKVRVSNPY